MMKQFRAGALALAGVLACALVGATAANAACPTPTYTGLTGQDATPAPQIVETIDVGGHKYPVPAIHGVNAAGAPKPVLVDANCLLDIDLLTVPSGAFTSGSISAGAIVDIGTGGSPAANTVNARLAALLTALGTPMQAGSVTTPPDVSSTGNTINSATPNAAYTVTLTNGEAVVGFSLTGLTASGATLTAEASNDNGATWATINTVAPATGALSTTVTLDSQFRVNAAGHNKVRLRVSSTGTGNITVASLASTASGLVTLSSPLTVNASLTAQYTGIATNPSSTLSLTTSIVQYTQGLLISNNATPASITVPSFSILNSAGAFSIQGGTLVSNDTAPSVQGLQALVHLYSCAPTYDAASGDHATWKLATGAGNGCLFETLVCNFNTVVQGDGNWAECAPTVPTQRVRKLAAGTTVYWDVVANSSTQALTASKTLVFTPEVQN